MVGQLQNPSCRTERRAPLYQTKVRGIGGLKEGMTDGADTVMVKTIEARSFGPYLARAGINIFVIFLIRYQLRSPCIPTVTKTYP